jgi:hypothetical protein
MVASHYHSCSDTTALNSCHVCFSFTETDRLVLPVEFSLTDWFTFEVLLWSFLCNFK